MYASRLKELGFNPESGTTVTKFDGGSYPEEFAGLIPGRAREGRLSVAAGRMRASERSVHYGCCASAVTRGHWRTRIRPPEGSGVTARVGLHRYRLLHVEYCQ